jgi:hypothetical protein
VERPLSLGRVRESSNFRGGYYDTPLGGHWSLVKLPNSVSLFWASFFGKKVLIFFELDAREKLQE